MKGSLLTTFVVVGGIYLLDYHNTRVVDTNIFLLEKELQRRPSMIYAISVLLVQQKSYKGQLLHILPPPKVDLNPSCGRIGLY